MSLAEKLKDAGVDTIGARLTAVCTEAIRQYPDNPAEAWRFVGKIFGHEFILGLMADMKGPPAPQPQPVGSKRADPQIATPAPYQPRVIPQERVERRRQLQQVVRSKYKNSGGIAWSDVGWHELRLLKRDGNEAEALLAAYSAEVPNDGRTVGDVLGIKRTDEIIAQVRAVR